MSPRPRSPEFLERHTYRLRRLMDAARLLPVFGMILLLLPLMRHGGDGAPPRVAQEAVYLFMVWIVLVLVAFVMSLGLRRALDTAARDAAAHDARSDPSPAPTDWQG